MSATHKRVLVAQGTANRMRGPWLFGWEIFDVDGEFRMVIHTTTYDGIRVDSHFATPEAPMEALTKDGAVAEAARATATYARTVLGGA